MGLIFDNLLFELQLTFNAHAVLPQEQVAQLVPQ
jgi:hypothetical protein